MGTIAQKLEYLNTTKSKLKDSINALGGEIDNNTTFREYAEELDTIYSNLPKVTGEGNNISLSPTLKGKLDLEYEGDIYQETLEGYNLLPVNSVTNIAWANGQAMSSCVAILNSLPNGEYKVIAKFKLTTKTGSFQTTDRYGLYLANINTSSGLNVRTSWDTSTIGTIKEISLTLTINDTSRGNFTNFYLYGCGNNSVGGTGYADVYDIQLSSGTTDRPFEPYCGGIPSPNPNYPQDIQVVTGTQTVTISNADNTESQTYTIHLGEEELYEDGFISNEDNKWYINNNYIKIKMTGNEAFYISNSGYWYYTVDYQLILQKNTSNILSNYFIIGQWAIQPQTNNICQGNSLNGLIGFAKSGFNTIEDLKSFLQNNDVYVLATLTNTSKTEITDTTLLSDLNNIKEKAMSYSGTTNILVSGNLPIVISASALKGE